MPGRLTRGNARDLAGPRPGGPSGSPRHPHDLRKYRPMLNSFRTKHVFSLRALGVAPAALLVLALAAPARADKGRDHRAPDLGDCQDLKVEAGNRVSFHAFGVGVQIYTWTGTRWSFVSPEAVLF